MINLLKESFWDRCREYPFNTTQFTSRKAITDYVSRTLILAATDTTSGALAQILQLLAQHPDVQDKLREEIIQAGNGQDVPYDQLVELPYLDAVCRETLRM